MTFEELDLEEELLDGLWDMNFRTCTPIQEQAIPVLLDGRDILGCAQTGTGKTAAYLLPILNHLLQDKNQGDSTDAIHAVIMVPTRELAQQIDQQIEGFAYYVPLSSVAVYGGNDGLVWAQQKKGLDAGADIIIATPGRLLSYIKLGLIDLSCVNHFVLDEADRMLDMGFIDDIMQVIKELPVQRQTMLFSATMPPKIRELTRKILRNPVEVRLAVSKPNENIAQTAYICYEAQKPALIQHLFGDSLSGEKVLIFASSKLKVKELTRILKRMNFNVLEMHSDLEQARRDEVMLQFKVGQTAILVATDIVSRGIDIDDIALVINYDVPHDPEDYVHRIGRTARAGEKGRAVTFVSQEDQYRFGLIERFLEKEIDKTALPEALGESPNYCPGKGNRSHAGYKKSRPKSKSGFKKTQSAAKNAQKAQARAEKPSSSSTGKPSGKRHAPNKNSHRDLSKQNTKA